MIDYKEITVGDFVRTNAAGNLEGKAPEPIPVADGHGGFVPGPLAPDTRKPFWKEGQQLKVVAVGTNTLIAKNRRGRKFEFIGDMNELLDVVEDETPAVEEDAEEELVGAVDEEE
jgi:hypothetical protein